MAGRACVSSISSSSHFPPPSPTKRCSVGPAMSKCNSPLLTNGEVDFSRQHICYLQMKLSLWCDQIVTSSAHISKLLLSVKWPGWGSSPLNLRIWFSARKKKRYLSCLILVQVGCEQLSQRTSPAILRCQKPLVKGQVNGIERRLTTNWVQVLLCHLLHNSASWGSCTIWCLLCPVLLCFLCGLRCLQWARRSTIQTCCLNQCRWWICVHREREALLCLSLRDLCTELLLCAQEILSEFLFKSTGTCDAAVAFTDCNVFILCILHVPSLNFISKVWQYCNAHCCKMRIQYWRKGCWFPILCYTSSVL